MDEATFIRNWHQLNNAFGNPTIDKDIKYKRCGNCIVQMKRWYDTKDNEMRRGVCDPRYAKYRANKLMVVKIYDSLNDRFVPNIHHTWHWEGNALVPIDYIVEQIAVPNGFDENIEEVCTKGIHYFNTLFAAYCYDQDEVVQIIHNGRIKRSNPHSSREEDKVWFETQLHQSNVIC